MLTFRVLSALLRYPTPELKSELAEAERILRSEGLLNGQHVDGVCGFLHGLRDTPQLEAESAHVDAFDRGRSTSLYLFEHIHGESRERGQAMVKLLLRYRAHGLDPSTRELPDFLPLFLEFLSTRPPAEAGKHLAEVADIVALIGRRLRRRNAPYAPVLEAVAALARHDANVPAPVVEPDDAERDDSPAALDAAWEEAPVVFNDVQGAPGIATR
jgi:nitrate reductase delta subunit